MWFYDYMGAYEAITAPGDYRYLAKHGWLKYDVERREILRRGVTPEKIEGSFSSVVTVSFDGSVIRMLGNPSRWGRLDNVFGVETIDGCFAVFNSILADLDLPPFTKGQYFEGLGKEGDEWGCTGARINRLDVTRNWFAGQGNERPLIRALGTISLGKGLRPNVYPNGLTVDWLRENCKASQYIYEKVYAKGLWLGDDRRKEKHVATLTGEDLAYYEQLKEWAEVEGLLRHELKFGKKFFAKHPEASCWGGWDINAPIIMNMLGRLDKAMKTLAVGAGDMNEILGRLIDSGLTARQARTTYNYWKDWRDGEPFQQTSSWYVHRNRLLDVGIDISVPAHNAIMYLPRIKAAGEIELAVATPPEWYRRAA